MSLLKFANTHVMTFWVKLKKVDAMLIIEKSGCYVNNGKYGYFLTCGTQISILNTTSSFINNNI